MPAHELARELLNAARSDLKALNHMLDPDAFDDRIFGFHAQQAVEKALKAWLNCLGGVHPFTHDLSLLLHTLGEQGASIGVYEGLLDLTGYAVRFRYEALPVGEEPLDRGSVIAEVRDLVDHVAKLS